jgi:hypothetical protein
MKLTLKIEEFFLFGLTLLLFGTLDYAWWLYPLLFLLPDLSMAGYLSGPQIGARVYNLVHHKAVAIGLYVAGVILGIQMLRLTGLILLGHTSLDRALGYGLKYPSTFQDTHLGVIGNPKG